MDRIADHRVSRIPRAVNHSRDRLGLDQRADRLRASLPAVREVVALDLPAIRHAVSRHALIQHALIQHVRTRGAVAGRCHQSSR